MVPGAEESRSVRPRVFVPPLGVWVLMALVAVINGVLRETVLIPRIGAYPGHVLSTAVLVVVILGITAVYFRRVSVEYRRLELLVIGALWMGLTVGFEFLVGYVENTPVAVTLGQYDVLAGQVWIAVPVTLLVSPLVFGWYLRR